MLLARAAPTITGRPQVMPTIAVEEVKPPSSAIIAAALLEAAATNSSLSTSTTRISPFCNLLVKSALVLQMHSLPATDLRPIPVPLKSLLPTVTTLIKFVLPGVPIGTPAVITTEEPSLITPLCKAHCRLSSIISSVLAL